MKVLSEDVGKTPIRLRRKIGSDSFEDATEHPLFEVLHALPNAETDAFTFVREMTIDLLLYGAAFAQIVRQVWAEHREDAPVGA